MDSIDSLLSSSTTPTNANKLNMDDLFDSYLSHNIPHTSTSQLIGHLPALEGSAEEESKEFDAQDFDTLPPLSPIYSPNSVADDLYQMSSSSLSSTTTPVDSLDQLDSEDEDDDSVSDNQHHATPSITSQHQTTSQLSAKSSTRTSNQRTAATKRKTTAQDSDSSYREDSDSSNGDKSSSTKGKGSKDGDSEKGGSNKQQRRRLQNRNAAATSRMKRKQYVTSLEEKVEGLLAQQSAMTESLNQLQSENQQLKQLMQRQAPQQLQALPSQQRQLSATDGDLPAINLEQSAVPQQLYIHQGGFRSLADELHLHDKSSIAATQPTTRVFNFDSSPSTMTVFDTINSQPSASDADQSLSLLPVCRTGLSGKVTQPALIKRVDVAEYNQQWVGKQSTAKTLPWSVAASDSAPAAMMVQLLVQTMLSFNLLAMLPLLLSSSGAAPAPWSKQTPTCSSTLTSSAVFWRTLIEQQTLWQEHTSQQLSRSHPCRMKSTDCLDGTPMWVHEWSDTLTPHELPHRMQPRVIEITI